MCREMGSAKLSYHRHIFPSHAAHRFAHADHIPMGRAHKDLPGRGRCPKRVKAAAYRYADGGPTSHETRLAQYIDRFGAQAVLGRKLYAREIYRIITAENILTAYRSSEQAANIATW